MDEVNPNSQKSLYPYYVKAVQQNDHDKVRKIINFGGTKFKKSLNDKGWIPFEEHSTEIYPFLVSLGMNARRSHNDQALALATRQNDVNTVQFLLDHDADVHSRNDDPIRSASREGHLAMTQLLLQRGANVHAEDEEPFIIAVDNQDIAMVRLLLEHGADVHAGNDIAMEYALFDKENKELVDLLVEHGAVMPTENYQMNRIGRVVFPVNTANDHE